MKKTFIIIGGLGIVLFVISGIAYNYILSEIGFILIIISAFLFIKSINKGGGVLAQNFSPPKVVYVVIIILAIIISVGIYFFYHP